MPDKYIVDRKDIPFADQRDTWNGKMAKAPDELDALRTVLEILQSLDDSARIRILSTIDTYFNREASGERSTSSAHQPLSNDEGGKPYSAVAFSAVAAAPSPKQFLLEKRPHTDVERVACLAFYLSHYRSMPHFKTVDISKLNSEAAQLKLSNTTYAVSNARAAGYITGTSRGVFQISAPGERFVLALPDREQAKRDMASALLGRRGRQQRAREGGRK